MISYFAAYIIRLEVTTEVGSYDRISPKLKDNWKLETDCALPHSLLDYFGPAKWL